jgi:hypothetical protein
MRVGARALSSSRNLIGLERLWGLDAAACDGPKVPLFV